MPKLTYRARSADDPAHTKVGPYHFESGVAVDVDDATAADLKGNPWFTGGKAAAEDAESRLAGTGTAPGPDSGIDSSVMPAYPPGQGMKYAPEAVMTADGLKPADDAETDETRGAYELKHKGRGVYDVMQGDKTVATGLTKSDATAWVDARTA